MEMEDPSGWLGLGKAVADLMERELEMEILMEISWRRGKGRTQEEGLSTQGAERGVEGELMNGQEKNKPLGRVMEKR